MGWLVKMPMTLVSSVTVGAGGASSIQFNSIPQTGKDLLALVSVATTAGAGFWVAYIVLNGNYRTQSRGIQGDGSAVGSYSGDVYSVPGTSTANTFGSSSVYIPNYTNSSAKIMSIDNVTERNATNSNQEFSALTYSTTTSGITSLSLEGAGTLSQYSKISLYLIN